VPDTADRGTRPSGPLLTAPRHFFRRRTTVYDVDSAVTVGQLGRRFGRSLRPG